MRLSRKCHGGALVEGDLQDPRGVLDRELRVEHGIFLAGVGWVSRESDPATERCQLLHQKRQLVACERLSEYREVVGARDIEPDAQQCSLEGLLCRLMGVVAHVLGQATRPEQRLRVTEIHAGSRDPVGDFLAIHYVRS